MTFEGVSKWLTARPKRWAHLQRVPMRHLWIMMTAAFLLFSVVGFYVDLMSGGTIPYSTTLAYAVFSGLNAVVWVLVLARAPMYWLLLLIGIELFNGQLNMWMGRWMERVFDSPQVAPETGLHFAATAILVVVISSYFFFARYMGATGREAFRIQNELALAHTIQKTLVPRLSQLTRCFEIYGISDPSEKVGGDLVDLVELSGGDSVAYLADIAGHGLQAGILMGMLKTSARTALADRQVSDGGATLSTLMQRLNRVLPQVKEAHMYATFAALRLSADGQVYYGMAASTPLLHWTAADRCMERIEREQFPLGLLPVPEFPANGLTMGVGDLLLIATDGILEVTSELRAERGVEFGVEKLEKLVTAHAELPLAELAAKILQAVRSYGKQLDDQTLLLVRRHCL